MKRAVLLALALVIAAAAAPAALAAPPSSMAAPENMVVTCIKVDEIDQLSVFCTVPDPTARAVGYGTGGVRLFVQFDRSGPSTNDFIWEKEWDTDPAAAWRVREITDCSTVFGDSLIWLGDEDTVAELDGQLYIDTAASYDTGSAKYAFNFDRQPFYINARFFAIYTDPDTGEETIVLSDWSGPIAAVRDRRPAPVTVLDAPVITALEVDAATGAVSFDVTHGDAARYVAVWMACTYDETVKTQYEISVDSGGWQPLEVGLPQVAAGTASAACPSLEGAGSVALRARCAAEFADGALYSDWSEPVSWAAPAPPEPEPEPVCPVCGGCAQPLGLCVYIWAAGGAAVVAAAVIVLLIVVRIRAGRAKSDS